MAAPTAIFLGKNAGGTSLFGLLSVEAHGGGLLPSFSGRTRQAALLTRHKTLPKQRLVPIVSIVQPKVVLAALKLEYADGGGGNDGPGNPGGSGGGGQGDSKGDGDFVNPFALIVQGVKSRMAADPDFAYKLFVECGLDAAIIIFVNIAARGDRFFSELEFVLCQLLVSLLNDFALVYLLAPTLNTAVARTGTLNAVLDKLPSHFLQRAPAGQAPFTVPQRLGCLAVKGVQYGTIGFTMGVLGTSMVHGLTYVRERIDPTFEPPHTVQSILGTGFGWLYFMSVSSNARYNIVNAAEDFLYASCPGVISKVGSIFLRLTNNFVGAHSWVNLAKSLKLDRPRQPRNSDSELADVQNF